MLNKKEQRLRRSRQTRLRIAQQRVVRLTVYRSNQHVYASVISEDGSRVLASASTAEKEVREQLGGNGNGGNAAAAAIVGKRIAPIGVLDAPSWSCLLLRVVAGAVRVFCGALAFQRTSPLGGLCCDG